MQTFGKRFGFLVWLFACILMVGVFLFAGCSSSGGGGGATWYTGTETPTNDLGTNGDMYYDTDDYILYQKTNGYWTVLIRNLGKESESASEIELQVANGYIQWRYSTGSDTSWKNLIAVETLKGADGTDGQDGENGTDGSDGREILLQVSEDYVQYKYEGDENWIDLILLSALKGSDGATWYSGEYDLDDLSTNSVGSDGDFYLNTQTFDIYQKADGAWALVGNIKGTDGATWLSGEEDPTETDGNVGDFYFNTSTCDVYLKTDSTTWTWQANLKGEDGSSSASEVPSGVKTQEVSLSGTEVFVENEDVWDEEVDMQNASTITWHHTNRFDYESAEWTKGSYKSYYTLTKENNGLTIDFDFVTPGCTSAQSVYTTYTAERSGTLWVSLEQYVSNKACVRELGFKLSVTDADGNAVESSTPTEICRGEGQAYQCVEVEAGYIVTIRLYSHIDTSLTTTCTLYYKNIQVQYGSLTDFVEYVADETYTANASTLTYVEKTINLGDFETDDWKNSATSTKEHYYYKLSGASGTVTDNYITDALDGVLPSANGNVANVTVTGLDLISYNAAYNETEGVGINSSGLIAVYIASVSTRSELPDYFASNPVTITYTTNEQVEVKGEVPDFNLSVGEWLEADDEISLTYTTSASEEKIDVVMFGDSITGMYDYGCDIPSIIEVEDASYNVVNAGFSGTRWTDHSTAKYVPFNMTRLVDSVVSGDFSTQEEYASTVGGYFPLHLANLEAVDFNEVEYVVIFYGTNDYASSVPLWSSEDDSEDEKYRTNVQDAVVYSISQLLTAFPQLQIVVVCPYWSGINSDKFSQDSDGNYVNNIDHTVQDYSDAIEQIATTNFHCSTINLYNQIQTNEYTLDYLTADGTHPNEKLKRIIAKKILSVLNGTVI